MKQYLARNAPVKKDRHIIRSTAAAALAAGGIWMGYTQAGSQMPLEPWAGIDYKLTLPWPWANKQPQFSPKERAREEAPGPRNAPPIPSHEAACSDSSDSLEGLVREHGQYHLETAQKYKGLIDPRLLIAVELAENSCPAAPLYWEGHRTPGGDARTRIEDSYSSFEKAGIDIDGKGFPMVSLAAYYGGQVKVFRAIDLNKNVLMQMAYSEPDNISKRAFDLKVYEIIKYNLPRQTRDYVEAVMWGYHKLEGKFNADLSPVS